MRSIGKRILIRICLVILIEILFIFLFVAIVSESEYLNGV